MTALAASRASRRKVPLGELCEFLNGGTPSKAVPAYWQGDIPWITSAEINGGSVRPARFGITQEAIADSAARKVPSGTLLLVIRTGVGKVALASYDLTFNQDINAVIPNEERLAKRYLLHFLGTQSAYFDRFSRGATVRGITREYLDRLEIPLPFPDDPKRSLAEQKRIAAVLDKADAIRRRRQAEFRSRIELLPQSIFHQMFGEPSRNPRGWNLATVGDVIRAAQDGPHVSPQYSPEGVPFLSTRNIRPGTVVWDDLKYISREQAEFHWQKCRPQRGDILYTKGGTTGLAKAIDFDRDIAVWVHVAVLKTNHELVHPLWLEAMLNTPYCYTQSQRYTHGITNRDLGLTRMVRIKIILPPKDLQDTFALQAMRAKHLAADNDELAHQYGDLFNSLVQRAFRGEL